VSQTLIDMQVEGVYGSAEFGWCLGLVGGDERAEHTVVDLGVEDCEAEPVGGEVVGVGVRAADHKAVEAQPGQVIAGLRDSAGGAEQPVISSRIGRPLRLLTIRKERRCPSRRAARVRRCRLSSHDHLAPVDGRPGPHKPAGVLGIVGEELCKGAEPQTVRIFARYSDQVVVGELVWDRKVSHRLSNLAALVGTQPLGFGRADPRTST
jgi:hypothetical protein